MMAVFEPRLEGLSVRGGRLWLQRPDRDEVVAVTPRYLRPLTSPTEIVFLDEKKREVAAIAGLDALTEEGRPWVEAALREHYHLAVIRRVDSLDVRLGARFWRVLTDRGPREFALTEPGKNVLWLSERRLVLRDTVGNRFEIPDLTALDRRSQRLVLRLT